MLKLTTTIMIAALAVASTDGAAFAGKLGGNAIRNLPTTKQAQSSQNHDHWNHRPYCVTVVDDNGHAEPRCASQ